MELTEADARSLKKAGYVAELNAPDFAQPDPALLSPLRDDELIRQQQKALAAAGS